MVQIGKATIGEEKLREYESYMYKGVIDERLKRVQEAYDRWQKTRTFEFPTWLYSQPLGRLFKVEVEDSPTFGETAWLEFDSARTAFFSIDMQGWAWLLYDKQGYDTKLIDAPVQPIKNCLDAIRKTDIKVVHFREGHRPDLADCPFRKSYINKIVGKGLTFGSEDPGGSGRIATRGYRNHDTIREVYPIPGEYIVDKSGKGAFHHSDILQLLLNMYPPPTHLVLTGITTDVCVHTIMREANDFGFWCLLLKDCTGSNDRENYLSAIKQIKMRGGVFGWVSDSQRFLEGLETILE